MRFDRDLLIFKALCALSEYADASYETPVKPTFALRFALAFLYSQSNGESRFFTDFWNAVQDPQEGAYHPDRGQYQRATNARTALNGIMNAVPRWKCPGVPHRMINMARSLGNADQVFRDAKAEEAKRVAEWEKQKRERRERAERARDGGYV